MNSNKIVGILVSVLVICIGLFGLHYAREMQEWHTQQFFGQDEPENNWLYRQMTAPTSIATNKIVSVAFILGGLLLLFLSLIK